MSIYEYVLGTSIFKQCQAYYVFMPLFSSLFKSVTIAIPSARPRSDGEGSRDYLFAIYEIEFSAKLYVRTQDNFRTK
jgi:hypothetical protein